MLEVVVLALAASGFTALASVAQRQAAGSAPGELSFSWRLAGYLLHRPVWFLGIAGMILGFLFQVAALRMGSLSLVQPLIATELVIVFGTIAVHDRSRVRGRDWVSAIGMVVGLGAFLALARPSNGHHHASSSMWVLAGVSTFAVAGLLAALAYAPGREGHRPSAGRKAAFLGVAAAAGFGFVAAVVKELSTHLSQGPAGVFDNWSPYVLLLSGAAAMFLASNAFQAGSLAASQPGLTIVDPLVASALGVVLFGERLDLRPLAFLGDTGPHDGDRQRDPAQPQSTGAGQNAGRARCSNSLAETRHPIGRLDPWRSNSGASTGQRHNTWSGKSVRRLAGRAHRRTDDNPTGS